MIRLQVARRLQNLFGVRVHTLAYQGAPSFTAASNLGMMAATGQFIVLINKSTCVDLLSAHGTVHALASNCTSIQLLYVVGSVFNECTKIVCMRACSRSL